MTETTVAPTLLQPLTVGPGYLRAGLFGFGGSGKTLTAMLLACAVREHFKDKRPVAMYDSEKGLEYVRHIHNKLTGIDPIAIASRSFDDLCASHREAASMASVFLADSITHPWRELCDTYLVRVNIKRAKKELPPRSSLTIRDWMFLKETWNKRWATPYLQVPIHNIVCGRAGEIFDLQSDPETGQDELKRVGVKMKAEGEFGYEPGLLIYMERAMSYAPTGGGVKGPSVNMARRATVMKDRFNAIDGATELFATTPDIVDAYERVKEFFLPHLELLHPQDHTRIREVSSKLNVDLEGNTEWARERKEREIMIEEIKGEFDAVWAGQSAENKKLRAAAQYKVFGTRSGTKLSTLQAERLRMGLIEIKKMIVVWKNNQATEDEADA